MSEVERLVSVATDAWDAAAANYEPFEKAMRAAVMAVLRDEAVAGALRLGAQCVADCPDCLPSSETGRRLLALADEMQEPTP